MCVCACVLSIQKKEKDEINAENVLFLTLFFFISIPSCVSLAKNHQFD